MDPDTSITDECIEWDGWIDSYGYGLRTIARKTRRVHRFAWEDEHGPIPNGLFVLHRCDNPPCFLVDHLFLGTQSDNLRDAAAKGRLHAQKKTHCPAGHELIKKNLRLDRLAQGKRVCRLCENERSSRYYHKNKKQR